MSLLAVFSNLGDEYESVTSRSGVFFDRPSTRNLPNHSDSPPLFLRSSISSENSTTSNANTTVQTSGTSTTTILACNSISIIACALTLALYLILSFRRKYKRLMRRTSLSLAACMAATDLVLHCSNLVGYGELPPGFPCAFVGGWLFAAPTLLSIFYSCCIALNSQLVFVFHRRPSLHSLRYYILISIGLTLAITVPALVTGTYGYDESWGYCWYSTRNSSPTVVIIRMTFTYTLPTFLCILYLLVATITIYYAVFGKRSRLFMSPVTTPGEGSIVQTAHERQVCAEPCTPPTNPPIPTRRSSFGAEQQPASVASPIVYSTILYRNSTSSPEATPNPRCSRSPLAHSRDSSFDPNLTSPQSPMSNHNPSISYHASPINPSYDLSSLPLPTSISHSTLNPPTPFTSGSLHSGTKESGHKDAQKIPNKGGWRMEKRRSEMAMRRTAARRQLSIRLIGYLITPMLCLLPGVIFDLLTKVRPQLEVPNALNGIFDGLNGLIGLLNSLLMMSDPALLAVWADLKCSMARERSNCIKLSLCPFSKSTRASKDSATHRSTNEEERSRGQDRDILSGFGIGVRTRLQEIEEEDERVEHNEENDGKVAIGVKEDEWQYPPKSQPRVSTTSDRGERKSAAIDVQSIAHRSMEDIEGGIALRSPLEVRVQVDVEMTSTRRPKDLELVENWLAGL